MWQDTHCPLPKKNCFPAAASPGALVLEADAFSATIIVTKASKVSDGRSNAGMPAAGIPFLMTFRTL
jgi:hypothetical protein